MWEEEVPALEQAVGIWGLSGCCRVLKCIYLSMESYYSLMKPQFKLRGSGQ